MSNEQEKCEACRGQGWVEDYEIVAGCCGGSDWECGASGCTGPVPEQEQIQVPCEACQSTGLEHPSITMVKKDLEQL